MKRTIAFCIALAPLLTGGCDDPSSRSGGAGHHMTVIQRVDGLAERVSENGRGLTTVVTIDHARLAKAAGVEMPPSVVTVVSDPTINSALMKLNPRLGLDLPHKILAYAEPGSATPMVAFAESSYLMKRHGIHDAALFDAYQQTLDGLLMGIPEGQRSPVRWGELSEEYGVIELTSDYSLESTLDRLKDAVLSQGDAVWFGEVDFRADAAGQGIEISGATLLLFGGPGPGGRAMADFPKLGLDAFCQKVLVYEDAETIVRVAFNDIVALAELHYGRSNPPQNVINTRLRETFVKAIEQSE